MTSRFHRLSCLFVAGVSGHTFRYRVQLQCVAACYMTLMMLPPFPRKKDPLLHLTDLFAKGTYGRFSALDKLFFPSCELHVLPVVLTSRQPTPHVTAHTSPYGGVGVRSESRCPPWLLHPPVSSVLVGPALGVVSKECRVRCFPGKALACCLPLQPRRQHLTLAKSPVCGIRVCDPPQPTTAFVLVFVALAGDMAAS